MSRVTLIRHGLTEANEKHLYCGSTDISLSQKGIDALRELKKTAAYPVYEEALYVSSGLKRCNETLEILYGKKAEEELVGLREMDFGAFEMRSYEEMKEDPDYIAWCSGDNEKNIAPGGESGEIMTARVLESFRELILRDRDTVAVSHGGVIAAVMAECFPGEGKNRYEWQPGGGKGYELTVEKGKVTAYRVI